MDAQPLFSDRAEAGLRLGAALKGYAGERPLVLGLPRCGVPVARAVADVLQGDLDILLLRTVRAPDETRIVLATVLEGDPPLVRRDVEQAVTLGLTESALEIEVAGAAREIDERRRLYRQGLAPPHVTGRTVLLVDQAIRSGSSMAAAIDLLRPQAPARLILATPIAAATAKARLAAHADRIVALHDCDPVGSMSRYYRDAHQVTHDEVIRCLKGHAPSSRRRPTL